MASTENKLEFVDGDADVASAGTAVALASSSVLLRWVIITAKAGNTAAKEVLLGTSTVVGAAGATRRGTPLGVGASVTISVDETDSLGLRGARAGQRFIDMSELYIDNGAGETDGVSWFGYR